ncbi:hypothetical protein [Maioricimonas sp. JC845]|uniref:hypothetical protein n=1 Tax=Maioricimonas sp. JC845 TaxID=3232138 RepID=UPI0034593D42
MNANGIVTFHHDRGSAVFGVFVALICGSVFGFLGLGSLVATDGANATGRFVACVFAVGFFLFTLMCVGVILYSVIALFSTTPVITFESERLLAHGAGRSVDYESVSTCVLLHKIQPAKFNGVHARVPTTFRIGVANGDTVEVPCGHLAVDAVAEEFEHRGIRVDKRYEQGLF